MIPGLSGRFHCLCHGWSSTVSGFARCSPHAPVYLSTRIAYLSAWQFENQCELPRAQDVVVTDNMLASVHHTVNIPDASQAFIYKSILL